MTCSDKSSSVAARPATIKSGESSATASVAAKMGLKCTVFMGEVDVKRQYPNVYAMKLMGAEVIPVTTGTRTLKDAVNEALKFWIENRLEHKE